MKSVRDTIWIEMENKINEQIKKRVCDRNVYHYTYHRTYNYCWIKIYNQIRDKIWDQIKYEKITEE